QVTVEEVMTTTAYLDLFLRSVSEPALLKIFLRFILLHRHENVHILDTLTSRINTPFRLCVVSLALFRTLIGLHCEDVMLQLVLRYLIPCNHMMLSQRWAVKERDCYSASAAKLLALTPVCCSTGITLTLESQGNDYILWTKAAHTKARGRRWGRMGEGENNKLAKSGLESLFNSSTCPDSDRHFSESTCVVDYGRAVDISYLQYLGEAQEAILQCLKDCKVWSALYDGVNPDPDTFIQTLAEENIYRLYAQKDTQDGDNSKEKTLNAAREREIQSQTVVNRPRAKSQLEMDLDEHSKRNSSLTQGAMKEQINQKMTEIDQQPDLELKLSPQEADRNLSVGLLSTDGEDFIAQYDKIIKELDPNSASLEQQKLDTPDPVSPVEEEEDFENFSADTPSTESVSSPFGPKEDVSPKHAARSQSAPFTGPFISVVLSKLENMLENSLHVNLLLIGIITQLASYPQPLLRSFLLNTNMVFQPSVRSLYQVLASVKNKIEHFASIEKDFPGLLLEAQQYLLFRVDMSDATEELLTKGYVFLRFAVQLVRKIMILLRLLLKELVCRRKGPQAQSCRRERDCSPAAGNVQHSSNTAKGRNLSAEAYPAVLQPFLGQKGKKGLAHPRL
ncbi:Protein FAM160A1, partial [Buceros rhinoceros silvestris]